MKPFSLRTMLIVLVAYGNLLLAGPAFETHFTDKTLRLDYYHTGTATEEHVAFDQIVQDGPWAGSKTNLIDDLRLGKYLFLDQLTWEEDHLANIPYAGKTGLYEGAMYQATGVYRSAPACIMHIRTNHFCPACQHAINLVIDQYTN